MSSQNPEARIEMPEKIRRFLSGFGSRIPESALQLSQEKRFN